MKPVILHLSNDYPDPLIPNKTRAVINLVEGMPQYRHVVYAMNRSNGLGGLIAIPFGDDRIAVAYGALPKGLLWERRLPQVARWISDDLKAKNIRPDIIEAHKFTIEGVIGLILAKEFNCPLICDIQGGSDVRILKAKKSMNKTFREIADYASAVLPYAPWSIKPFEEEAGLDPKKCYNLPVISALDTMSSAPIIHEKLVSVFHLDSWERKNFQGMVQAVKLLSASRKELTLDIYGRGSPETFLKMRSYIARAGMKNRVFLKGPVESNKLQETLQKYSAFVLPSKTETYGLVYAESLFSGLPVLMNKNQGISGYFEHSQIGYGCDAGSVEDIARGMAFMLDQQKQLKENIAQMQKRGVFDFMRRHAILKVYSGVIDSVLAGRYAKVARA